MTSMSWIEDPGVTQYEQFDLTDLEIDQAWLNVTVSGSRNRGQEFWLYGVSNDCYKCPYQLLGKLSRSALNKFKIDAKHGVKYRIRNKGTPDVIPEEFTDSHWVCPVVNYNYGEFGVYNLYTDGDSFCHVETALPPVNIYYPLLIAFLFYLFLGIFVWLVSSSHRHFDKLINLSKIQKLFTRNSSSSSSEGDKSNEDDKDYPRVITNPQGVIITRSNNFNKPLNPPSTSEIYSTQGFRGSTLSVHNSIYSCSASAIAEDHGQQQDVINNGVNNGGTEISISTESSSPTFSLSYNGHPYVNHSTSHLSQQQNSKLQNNGDKGSIRAESIANCEGNMKPYGGGGINQAQNPYYNYTYSGTASTPNPAGYNVQVQNEKVANVSSVSSPISETNNNSKRQRQRLRSLDVFRGLCIVIMIFVNDGGAGYYFFNHATWDGLYIADLVFPWFLWIMGVCIPVSIKSQIKRGSHRWKILKAIVIRSLKLIGLGLILGSIWGPVDFQSMRIPGVLQRFGLSYFFCAVLVLICMTVNITKPETNKIKAALQDVQIIWVSWIVILLLVLVHCLVTFFLPVNGCPTGYLGPGGLHLGSRYPGHCIGGAAGLIDKQVLLINHIYRNPTAKSVYGSEAFDPEGLLGTLTSIFQVWLGVQTGATMLVYPRPLSRLKRWGSWCLITGIAGGILCGFEQHGGWIPMNKNLWSLSFVLVTNCLALAVLSIIYFIVDVKKLWSGAPFFQPGMNSILLYVGHSIAHALLPWHYVYGPMNTHFSRLLESLWGTSLWVIIAVYFYQQKVFWTL